MHIAQLHTACSLSQPVLQKSDPADTERTVLWAKNRHPSLPQHNFHKLSGPRLRSFQVNKRHREFLRCCPSLLPRWRNLSTPLTPRQRRCPVDKQSTPLMRPGRCLQYQEDTPYMMLRHLYSRDRLGTAHNQSMDQSLGRPGLLHRRDRLLILRPRVILQDKHSLLHHMVSLDHHRYRDIQMGSAYTQLPQMVHNSLHRTVCTV